MVCGVAVVITTTIFLYVIP